nr:hypothetical protein [Allobranchiibius huperziae]
MSAASAAVASGCLVFASTASVSPASAAPAGGTYAHCPYGYACLYQKGDTDGSSTPTTYYHYGAHNLSNVTGNRIFFNNQSGGAVAYLCTGYNGTGSCFLVKAYTYVNPYNFTPVNSIYLSAKATK